ncbi:hypothetical protein OsJ_28933 [Oryza sativa Japonica Group]|uniref:Transposase MuDR plant domain-containing protein n=1 Tax=Oryza sativa subsp. japonica TaxID=39947 RepID=B9G2Z9_ORYSJ|nr:hypothetical protein OsJ_28933 [Oryza sativa Japonica Group]
MSFIEHDKVYLPEIIGHLKDHCDVLPGMLLHWLFPSKGLVDGLRVLVDDKVCDYMSICVVDSGVVEIYVETVMADEANESGSKDDSDFEDELEDMSPVDDECDGGHDDSDDEVFEPVREILVIASTPEKKRYRKKEDEEVKQIRKDCNEFKKKLKDGELGNLDDVIYMGSASQANERALVQIDGEDTASPYENSSSADDDSYEENSDGQLVTKKSKYPIFNPNKPTVTLALGMKFDCKKDFKEAVIKLALENHRFIRFPKYEGCRTRAKCDWQTCPWVCLLSKNSRTDSWQIASLVDEHNCPPRKDNHLVTYKRIAMKYEKMITDNPSWSIQSMQSTVSKQMFANVSVSQCKRAKAYVMKKIYESTRGEYSKIFDYLLELLRSNPGSIVVVKLDTDQPAPVFKRIYICLAACKNGFLVGYRRVVGLDGCFFKGATNGELLCAIGRDANNQMYPIAWVVVEKETNDSWDWFCDCCSRTWELVKVMAGCSFQTSRKEPSSEHRNCARHIYANWKKRFSKKQWQKMFWWCAKALNMMLFNLAKAKLAQETVEGARAIVSIDPTHWSRAWFRFGSDCDSVVNNICEIFNKCIV